MAKTVLIILLVLCIIGEVGIVWLIEQIREDITAMRKEYLDLIKTLLDDSNRYLQEWGHCIQEWQGTLEATKMLLKLLKEDEDEQIT